MLFLYCNRVNKTLLFPKTLVLTIFLLLYYFLYLVLASEYRRKLPICQQKRLDTNCIKPMHSTWCRRQELNPQPTDYDSVALPD